MSNSQHGFIHKLCFASDDFDRQALKRNESEWIEVGLEAETSLFLLFWENKFLTVVSELSSQPSIDIRFVDKKTTQNLSNTPLKYSFMGLLSNQYSKTKELKDKNRPIIFTAEITEPSQICERQDWHSLRHIGTRVTAEISNLLAYSQGLMHWQSQNRFCSQCASRLAPIQAGHGLVCSNAECGKETFPRTDPAIIVLIQNEDACLLGRNASWPETMYSCLAGFVETGEALEAAVRREVYEESGLTIDDIQYRGSQPWPFPQSLMLGFQAHSKNRQLTFHDGEIEEAIWFTREQLIKAVENQQLSLSSSLSISYHLIEDWYNEKSEISLSEQLTQIKNNDSLVK